jgi:hypothetical protein
VHEWLVRQADALSEQAGVRRELLEPSGDEIDSLRNVAAHASGARTNAPLLSHLLGVPRGARGLDELVGIVRSTS